MELDLQVSPEKIMSREVELGCESLTSFASSCSSTAVHGYCLCDSAQQQMRSAQVAGQWRGDTALTLPLFWRRSTVSPVFFGRYPRSSLHSFVPLVATTEAHQDAVHDLVATTEAYQDAVHGLVATTEAHQDVVHGLVATTEASQDAVHGLVATTEAHQDAVHGLVATTEAHHRPVWLYTHTKTGKGLQSKQSESLRAEDWAIQKPDQTEITCLTVYIISPMH